MNKVFWFYKKTIEIKAEIDALILKLLNLKEIILGGNENGRN